MTIPQNTPLCALCHYFLGYRSRKFAEARLPEWGKRRVSKEAPGKRAPEEYSSGGSFSRGLGSRFRGDTVYLAAGVYWAEAL